MNLKSSTRPHLALGPRTHNHFSDHAFSVYAPFFGTISHPTFMIHPPLTLLTRSIRDSESSIDFVQGPPGSRRERVKKKLKTMTMASIIMK